MKYRVTHTTTYTADEPVSVCHNVAWLTPRNTSLQRCEFHKISVDPVPSVFERRVDAFGNHASHFSFNEGYSELRVKAVSRVNVQASSLPDLSASAPWEEVRRQLALHRAAADVDALQFVFDSPRIRRASSLAAYAQKSFSPGRPILEAVSELTGRLHAEFEYDPRATTVTTPVLDVMQQRKGVCQDFAHLEIAMLRSLGLAARYVSGYVRTYPPPGQPRLVGADASHAWLSLYCGDLGWVDIDPTNNKFTTDEHITIAWGRDYSDVSPVKGVYVGGGQLHLSVSVDVAPVSTNGAGGT